MSAHTPGPWVAIPSSVRMTPGAHDPLFSTGLWSILPEANVERLPICVVDHADDHHAGTREKAEFDARLIAAAPDLLAALKSVLSLIDEGWLVRDTKNDGAPDWAMQQVSKVRRISAAFEAIDKATGATP